MRMTTDAYIQPPPPFPPHCQAACPPPTPPSTSTPPPTPPTSRSGPSSTTASPPAYGAFPCHVFADTCTYMIVYMCRSTNQHTSLTRKHHHHHSPPKKRLAPPVDGGTVPRTWIIYNRPRGPSHAHGGLLMALGLQVRKTRRWGRLSYVYTHVTGPPDGRPLLLQKPF